MKTLDVFTSELMADRMEAITVGFERDAPHQYEAKQIEIPLMNISPQVQEIGIDDEFEIQVFGMPVPWIYYVEEYEINRKSQVKTLRLSPLSKRLKEFRCGRLNFQKYEDNDFHLTADRVNNIEQDLLVPSFQRFGVGGREGYLFDTLGFTTPYVNQQNVELTSPVDISTVFFGFADEGDFGQPDGQGYTFFTLAGHISEEDTEGTTINFDPGLYVYIDGLYTKNFKYQNIFHLTKTGNLRKKGKWKKYPNLIGQTDLSWNDITQEPWTSMSELLDSAGSEWQDEDPVSNPQIGDVYYDRTWKKALHWNYGENEFDDGLGPFFGAIRYKTTHWRYTTIGTTNVGGAEETGWLEGNTKHVVRIFYSPTFLNHFVRADYTNPRAVEIWNDVAKMISGMWYADGENVMMDSRVQPAKSEMPHIPYKHIQEWTTRVQQRQERDYYPSDNLKLNTALRQQIVDNMDAIYGEQVAYHTLELFAHPGTDVQPGVWVRTGDDIIGLVSRMTYHWDRRVELEATGAAS